MQLGSTCTVCCAPVAGSRGEENLYTFMHKPEYNGLLSLSAKTKSTSSVTEATSATAASEAAIVQREDEHGQDAYAAIVRGDEARVVRRHEV